MKSHQAPWWFDYFVMFLVVCLGVAGFFYVHNISAYLNSRRHVSDMKNAATAQEQAASRLLVCTGLAELPQSPPVKALEAISYPIYGQPTKPYCPAPGAS